MTPPLGTRVLARVARAAPFLLSPEAHARLAFRTRARTPIRDVREGETAKIAGWLRPLGAPLSAPLSGRGCAYHRAVVLIEAGGLWSAGVELEGRRDFVVDDGTGVAAVRLDGARLALIEEDGPWHQSLTPAVEALLRARGLDAGLAGARGGGWNPPVRHREVALVAGEPVAVIGRAWRRGHAALFASAATPYREAPPDLVLAPAPTIDKQIGNPIGDLLVTDDPDCWG